ncbi:hypothetical protein RM549_18770 [Salegentibacter sp. F188]|uniref:Uncharacterized protein n=1 Tax=Autumnicola patrickiae TaxID=3075591 RepID=A0ABU3E7G3_9FLAO|nr:hypothetical protein [Salegentibacter sp. F188]MDT0691843.1 hypothetical protein [Salegentibacter sp. F188]
MLVISSVLHQSGGVKGSVKSFFSSGNGCGINTADSIADRPSTLEGTQNIFQDSSSIGNIPAGDLSKMF